MAKLFELLAVESELKARAISSIAGLKKLFQENQQVFEGQRRTYTPLHEDGQVLPSEDKKVQANVNDLMGETNTDFFGWVNVAIQKEETNTSTKAEVKSLGLSLSAPALLNLEARLLELRATYRLIPVNDPRIEWAFDEQLGCYKSDIVESIRLNKIVEPLVKYEATPEHPTQVELVSLDKPVGKWETVRYSAMLQPKEKQDILDKIDLLITEVKQARQRANAIDIKTEKVSAKVLDFIFQ